MKWIAITEKLPSEPGEYTVKYQNFILWGKVVIKTSKGSITTKFDGKTFSTRNNVTHWLYEPVST